MPLLKYIIRCMGTRLIVFIRAHASLPGTLTTNTMLNKVKTIPSSAHSSILPLAHASAEVIKFNYSPAAALYVDGVIRGNARQGKRRLALVLRRASIGGPFWSSRARQMRCEFGVGAQTKLPSAVANAFICLNSSSWMRSDYIERCENSL